MANHRVTDLVAHLHQASTIASLYPFERTSAMSETYTIHVRDEVFHLTKDQVEFNSPNYFTSCFFGDSVESQTRTLRLFRDPDLFKIVIDYLSGYQVLPLHGSVIPKRMSLELAVRNLRVDADYYLLDGLVDQIVEYQENDPPATSNAPEKIAHVLVIYQVSLCLAWRG